MTAGQCDPTDLLILLEVARSGHYVQAAERLRVNHTTISRRIAALERNLGAPLLHRWGGAWVPTSLGEQAVAAAQLVEAALTNLSPAVDASLSLSGIIRVSASAGFSAFLLPPAIVRLQQRHPAITVQIVTATRRASDALANVDFEIVVGEPKVRSAIKTHLADYNLGLYASPQYLELAGTPHTIDDLSNHSLIYFVDSMLQVDDLDRARQALPSMRDSISSTDPFVHLGASMAGGGISLVSCFTASRWPGLVRVLPEFSITLGFWLVARAEAVRRPAVSTLINELTAYLAEQRPLLHGHLGER